MSNRYTSNDIKGGFHLAPNAVMHTVSAGAYMVFSQIYASCKQPMFDGEITISKLSLSKMTGIARTTMDRYINELVSLKIIDENNCKQAKSSFKINWEEIVLTHNFLSQLSYQGISEVKKIMSKNGYTPFSQISPETLQSIQKNYPIPSDCSKTLQQEGEENMDCIKMLQYNEGNMDCIKMLQPEEAKSLHCIKTLQLKSSHCIKMLQLNGDNSQECSKTLQLDDLYCSKMLQQEEANQGDCIKMLQLDENSKEITFLLDELIKKGVKSLQFQFSDCIKMLQLNDSDCIKMLQQGEKCCIKMLHSKDIYKDNKKDDSGCAAYIRGELNEIENNKKVESGIELNSQGNLKNNLELPESFDETENLTEDKSPVKFNELLKWTERDLSKYDLLPANDLIEVFNKPEDYDLYQQTILREVLKDVLDTDRLTPVSVEEINSSNLTIPVSLFKRILYNVMEELQEKDLSLEMDEEAIKCMFGFPVLSPDTLQEPTFQIDLSQIRNVFWTEKRKVRKPKRSRYEERKRNILFMETLQETADRDIEILTNAEYATIKIFDLVDMRTENKQFHPDEFPALMFEKFIKDTAEESGVEEGDLQDLWKELPRRGGLVYLHPQQLSVDKILEYNHRHGEDSVVSKVWNERLEKKLEDDQLSQDDPD